MKTENTNEKINVPYLTVDKNIITYGNSFICVDNISMISISSVPKNNSWSYALILMVIGIAAIPITAMAALILIVAIIWLIAVLKYNYGRGSDLAISLNSGTTLYFNCRDLNFLHKVVNSMLESIKDKNQTTYSINFDKCQINGGVMHNSSFVER